MRRSIKTCDAGWQLARLIATIAAGHWRYWQLVCGWQLTRVATSAAGNWRGCCQCFIPTRNSGDAVDDDRLWQKTPDHKL